MLQDSSQLLKPLLSLAQQAGVAIMEVYREEDPEIEIKADHTPVTKADLQANEIIVQGLQVLTPEIPIISEELTELPFTERKKWTQYWLIDPLDGTKEFIERTDEFTVNIALIENGKPILGIVYAPALGIGYQACRGCGAFKYTDGGTYDFIQTRPYSASETVIAISRRHGKRAENYFSRLPHYELHYCGSALKICRVAEGVADIYPRLGKTSEWDTAAGQCVLEEAGGEIIDLQGRELRYNTKPSLLNPEFMAIGDTKHDWLQYFTD